jgi:hypothetical protein
MISIDALKGQMQGAWRSWTIWFNSMAGALLAGLPMLQDTLPQLQAYMPADAFKYTMGMVIAINILLRFKTNQPLAQK